jgi:NAD(P)-dependent dehydrogenase (short-subunit alcohol dehydrogenase family)
MSSLKSLGRVAIVTGAGTGIGRATALSLAADGYSVALAGRRLEPLQATADLIGAVERVLIVPTDVTQEAPVAALFAQTVDRFGHLDLLFNNAGSGAAAPIDQLTLAQWQGVVDVNLTGMFLCLREAFRVMKAQTPQGGRVINNGSISAYTPRPQSAAYTATKHGVMGLTKTAALEGRAHHIAVGQIDIGNAGTEMTTRMAAGILQANGSVMAEPLMDVNLVGESVLYMANLPLSANVLFHTVMATNMPFVGRG